MIGSKKASGILLILVAALALSSVLAWTQMIRARETARRSGDDVQACRMLAKQIRTLRDRPVAASDQAVQSPQLAKRIEEAGTLAGIARSSFDRIDPQSPRRLDRSVYSEVPTRVSLRQVSLRQVVNLLYNLGDTGAGLDTREIRLTAPREEAGSDLWHAELTLAYLMYDPPDSSASTSIRGH